MGTTLQGRCPEIKSRLGQSHGRGDCPSADLVSGRHPHNSASILVLPFTTTAVVLKTDLFGFTMQNQVGKMQMNGKQNTSGSGAASSQCLENVRYSSSKFVPVVFPLPDTFIILQETYPTYDKDQHEFLLHQLDLYIALCWVSNM